MDLYFDRHDGQAVTCEDFIQCMSDANFGFDLKQFFRWYTTSGKVPCLLECDFSPTH